jgi:hypothetical protein
LVALIVVALDDGFVNREIYVRRRLDVARSIVALGVMHPKIATRRA